MFFDLYWRFLGLPLSRIKGLVVDALPFSVVEISLWIGAAATLWLFTSWIVSLLRPRRAPTNKRLLIAAWLCGPVFLVALGLGQGAFPWSLAPTAWRAPLAERLMANDADGADSLPEDAFRAWAAARADSLRAGFAVAGAWENYQTLDEREALRACDRLLDSVLFDLGLPPGRRVRAFKNMGPWTTTLGLTYGGPAFHDPFFGEIAIVRDLDMPAPRHWRLIAACHEAAHAKGFTREMDAEILTQLALARSGDPRLRRVGDLHFLRKTGLKIAWPDSLLAEGERVRAARIEAEKRQPVIRTLREWARGAGVQNDAAKYGQRGAQDAWNPRHPFFATVRAAQRKIDGSLEPHNGSPNGP